MTTIMQQNNVIGAEIVASGMAEVMVYQSKAKVWDFHSSDKQPSTVQVVHDHENQTFMLVVSQLQNQRHVIVIRQQIYHNLKYQADNKFHQWRDETRTVYGLNFPNEQHAMDVHNAVREAQSFLNQLIKNEQLNGGNAVYQEPQQNHYYTAQPTTAQPRQQPEVVYARDADGDSLGSNGHRKYSNYTVHPQVTGQAIQQQTTLQQQQLIQQQRRASQGSSGSSSTVSGNIYAIVQPHSNGYNNGNAVSATSNGGTQMPINQIQQPIRLTNNNMNGYSGYPTLPQQQSNGHHQVPIRTAIPPAPAPSMMNPVNSNQPAQISNNIPVPPPPPPSVNGSATVRQNNVPPAPPLPPANICKANAADTQLTMAEQLRQRQLKKAEQNGGSNGTSTNGVKSKPPDASSNLMSELQNKLRKRNNKDEIASVTSAASTSSTNSNESAEKHEPPPAPKTWTKPVSTAPSTLSLSSTLTNGNTNGHTNGNIDSPKCHKKQFSVSGASSTNDDPNTIMCTKADLDQLRHDLFSELEKYKAEILDAIVRSKQDPQL